MGDLVYPDPEPGHEEGWGEPMVAETDEEYDAGGGHDEPAGLAGSAQPVSFRPASQKDLAPAGSGAKIAANLEALAVLRRLETERRAASQGEMAVLARWSGWGSAPELFDPGSRRYRSQAARAAVAAVRAGVGRGPADHHQRPLHLGRDRGGHVGPGDRARVRPGRVLGCWSRAAGRGTSSVSPPPG